MSATVALTELAIAGLQVFFAASRAAGLDEEQKKVLYDQTDTEYVKVSEKPLPSVDG